MGSLNTFNISRLIPIISPVRYYSKMATPYPCPVSTYRTDTYPAISPTQSQLSTKGRNVVITGGGAGIGAAIAQAFAASGAQSLTLLGRREDKLTSVKSALEAEFPQTQVFCHATDLTDRESVKNTFNTIKTDIQTIDVLVANAGYSPPLQRLEEYDDEQWYSAFDVNVKGNYHLVKAFLPMASNTAHVLNVTAGATHIPYLPGFSGYHASKLAAAKIFDYLHREHPHLFVLNFHPGLIKTGIPGNPNAKNFDSSKPSFPDLQVTKH